MGETAPARLDVITRHRLSMLGSDADSVVDLPLSERLQAVYCAFLERVPFENLSNNRVCAEHPGQPEAWPRTTDRFLRDNRAHGLGGTSFTMAYALRDLFRGVGANAHCTLGHNLVTEDVHAAVLVYQDEGPALYDPALLMCGPVPVRPGGVLEDPLGTITLKPRCGPTLSVCLRLFGAGRERAVYSIIPVPAPPPSFRQAWIASFCRGRARPLRIARRVGDEIRRYGERPGSLEILRAGGREERRLESAPVGALVELFGIDQGCLASWFHRGDVAST